ncbi:LysE family transporter [Halotia wernerae UHCC 0503]|nr:LysE family transporter [Halotia wernerae UHCC 0503]
MSGIEQLFVSALSLGFAYNATPGAINTESLRRGLEQGFWPALFVQLGALIGDTTWAIIALTSTTFIVQNRAVRLLLGVAGTFLLFWLAKNALSEAWSHGTPQGKEPSTQGSFCTGVFFSLASPIAIPFWLSMSNGLAARPNVPQSQSFVIFLSGFVLGALLWCLCIATLIGWGQRLVRPAFFQWVNALCGLILGYLSFEMFWNTLKLLFA